jgi:hypothetical protein
MPSGLIQAPLVPAMTLSDPQVHDWIASLVDRTAEQLRGELALLLRRVQNSARASDVVDVGGGLSLPAPGVDSRRPATGTSAAHDLERHGASILAADVLDAMRALDEAASLSEILNVLVDRSAVHASRVLLVVERGDRLVGWRGHGYPADSMDATSVEIAPGDEGLIRRAATSGSVESGRDPAAGRIGDASVADGRAAVAIPLRVEGQIVAVLYADAQPADAAMAAGLVRSPWPDVLCVLARHAARCVESMTARRLPELLRMPSDAAASPAGEAV